jgi:para-aminobenzoate synthetase component 1
VQLDYELGNRIEPGPRFRENPGPLGLAFRTRWGLARDEVTSTWWEFGERPSSIDLADLLKKAGPERRLWRLSRLQSEIGQDRFEAWVARAIEYIRAGDIFQVNLAHHMQGDFVGSARELAAALLRASKPMYGAYLETPPGPGARSVISLSPERFLSLSPGGVLRARPMKGTRPIHADPRELDASPKDRAELDMIIDLMRNDLGRVARLGSVNVTTQRVIEPHGRVWQASAEVEGVLRPGLGVRDVIEATFPPGSITGAPKYRAREIIDELEPRPRGPYCGCIGAITANGAAEFSVAIRTLTIDGESSAPGTFRHARASYPVGAGIVVDSSPRGEWEETLHKAAGVEDC